MKGINCYKVVTDSRQSMIIEIFRHRDLSGLRKRRYIKKYTKGKTVTGAKTHPIFCFKYKKDAQEFARCHFSNTILKVEGFEEINTFCFSHNICDIFEILIDKVKYYTSHHRLPKGTICFRKVKVLT